MTTVTPAAYTPEQLQKMETYLSRLALTSTRVAEWIEGLDDRAAAHVAAGMRRNARTADEARRLVEAHRSQGTLTTLGRGTS
jgi:hypothetical protein